MAILLCSSEKVDYWQRQVAGCGFQRPPNFPAAQGLVPRELGCQWCRRGVSSGTASEVGWGFYGPPSPRSEKLSQEPACTPLHVHPANPLFLTFSYLDVTVHALIEPVVLVV